MTRGAAFPLLVASLAVACPPAVRAAQSTTQDVAVLERGAPLVRTLTGGERHSYGLARHNRQHPFYWASFIQAGDWRPLGGQRDVP